ncbi:MAG: PAS domain S-box protein [Actinomycetia bacterium]|nr:PAS domain S-box protein [Actinomycetes bacterium]
MKGQEFKTGNFKKSRWRQSEDILLRGSVIGAVDICYLKKKPEADETSNVIIPAVMKTGQWDGESIVKRKDGSLVPIWLTISIAKDTDGKPMALVSTVKDIADIKKAETDLRKSEQWSRNMIDSA